MVLDKDKRSEVAFGCYLWLLFDRVSLFLPLDHHTTNDQTEQSPIP